MSSDESLVIGSIVRGLTKGQPFVFFVMDYKNKFFLYSRIKDVIEKRLGLLCIRADDVPSGGHDLRAKIHLMIERAELVIAEITHKGPNVYYEIGYAVGARRPLLLVMEKGAEVPEDLKGREFIEYSERREDCEVFEARLCEQVRTRVNSNIALLRDMLEAENSQPAYIVANPKQPTPTYSRLKGQMYDRRTYGDNLGVLGLISAFGSIMGEGAAVELISAKYGPPDLLDRDINLYLVGSPKVNPATEVMLEQLQRGGKPCWSLDPYPGAKKKDDYRVALYRGDKGKRKRYHGRTVAQGEKGGIAHKLDYGIIIRGPHPKHPGRMVMIMAGPHSLGTGAACLAATRSVRIQDIKKQLPRNVLSDKRKTIWVLVKGRANSRDGLLDVENVEVVDAGVYA